MDYELAKELKKAGFPQIGEGSTFEHGSMTVQEIVSGGEMNKEDLYFPALRELIDDCGHGFEMLTFVHAYDKKDCYWSCHGADDKMRDNFYSKTPEEAVARLWLALNKKHGEEK